MIKKVNVKGVTYKVKMCKLEETLSGDCDTTKKLIRLDETSSGDVLTETFFHEFFHAVLHEVGVDCAILPQIEEIIVDNCATALVRLFNKELKNADLED